MPPGLDWEDDLPFWMGLPSHVETHSAGEFTFEDIDLSDVRVSTGDPIDIEDQVKSKVALLGRRLTEGDSTDNWMIKFCGQMVRRGFVDKALEIKVAEFYEAYFDDSYTTAETEAWLRQKMLSAIQMDKSNYPEDYEDDGSRKDLVAPKPEASDALDFFTFDSAKRFLNDLAEETFWTEPTLPVGSIVQVVGYNGHGKSFFLTNMLTSLAADVHHFGPFRNPHASPKIAYYDFDNPARTILQRIITQGTYIGNPRDNLLYWSSAVLKHSREVNMNLLSDEGSQNMINMLRTQMPKVIVIDSVRNAFAGMDENSTQDWAKVNKLAKFLRDEFEATVVLVHHRNKPGQDGLGREAGSTAQLTDLDTQIIVTQVYQHAEEAAKKAGLFDAKLSVDAIRWKNGKVERVDYTPFGYILNQMPKGRPSRIRMVSQIGYGKVRSDTELHKDHYVGYCEYLDNRQPFVISTKSPLQQAQFLASKKLPPIEIAQELMVPTDVVKGWLQ